MRLLSILIFTALATLCSTSFSATGIKKGGFDWEKAIITVEVSGIQYDFRQPWSRQPRQSMKSGVVIRQGEILTTAQGLDNCIMVRLQRLGESRWWEARVKWMDYYANLAVLTAVDDKFFVGLKPAQLSAKAPDKENLHIVRWKGANLEARRVEFNQYIVDESELSSLNYAQMELESVPDQMNNPEVVVSDGKVAGLTTSKVEGNTRAIPSIFIRNIFAEQQKGQWRGLGYFPFYWQPSQNPALHQFLNLKGDPRGVVVIETSQLKDQRDIIKPLDIILEVDGFGIDMMGNYKDPDFGRLLLENLAVRNKFAGDIVTFKIWRKGEEQLVKFKLPKFSYSERLVPQQVFDKEPEYLIVGGLVFQPLTEPYLRSFGAEWRRIVPFRLVYLSSVDATSEMPSLVVLSAVLPDYFNIGYHDYRGLVVDTVNNFTVRNLTDLNKALKSPADGYHIIKFQKGDSIKSIVIDANGEADAMARILKRYNIPSASKISSK